MVTRSERNPILPRADPSEVIARCRCNILEPREPWELVTVIGLAATTIRDLVVSAREGDLPVGRIST